MASPPPPADGSVALAVREKVQQFLNAARKGNIDIFNKLAKQLGEGGEGKGGVGKTVADVKDANGRGALHFAGREGKTDMCKYLVEQLGIDVDPKDDDGETPLLHAARQGHFTTAKYLLDKGADPAVKSNELGASPLHHAVGAGNTDLLKLLLEMGLNVNSPSDAGTPLIWAAGHGEQEAVKILLEHNADPNAETEDNVTPLLSAVAAGSLPCLELLIKAGANANVSAGGATPLHVAADGGDLEIIKCLLKAGSDPNVSDEEGLKPVQIAALRGNREATKVLLPPTFPIDSAPSWSIDGLIEWMQQETSRKQDAATSKSGHERKNMDVATTRPVEVSTEMKTKSLEAKARGDEAFRIKDYLLAIDAYTQAIEFDPSDATLLSNRSLCWIRLGQAEQALADAVACRAFRPDWPKAYYREGAALRLLLRFEDAANAFYEGVKLEPENKELVNAFREAVEAGRKFHCSKEPDSEKQ